MNNTQEERNGFDELVKFLHDLRKDVNELKDEVKKLSEKQSAVNVNFDNVVCNKTSVEDIINSLRRQIDKKS